MKNTVADSKKRAERMKDQLRRRQERGSKRAVAGVENLSDVERKQASAITNLMTEADRTREESSLIAALKALEEVCSSSQCADFMRQTLLFIMPLL